MSERYEVKELREAAKPGNDPDWDCIRIKARGPMGDSKWLRVTPEEFERIIDVFRNGS